ncbi:hypothetical protein ACH5RR_035160 [Cinchona calisaya]|uniref:DUF4408 domain-containing protein n=1 Tax=Cinchona calisaya TaxID=153742 RepID=A0ABD2YD14_9GENT
MDSHQQSVFDNVKFEKEKAMARFNRFRKITKILQFLEVSVALLLISWSSTRIPGALKISGRCLFEVANYLFNPHIVFVIGNAIIVAVFVLCRENNAGKENSGEGDIYDNYLRHSEAHARAQERKVSVSQRDENPAPEPPATPEIKDLIDGSGGGDEEEDEDEKQIVYVFPEEKTEQFDAVTTAIEEATEKIQTFQRIQSQKLKREIAVKNPRVDLRRSETVKVGRLRTTERPEMTSFDTVDKLSNEEFNLTIEAFIKRHQKFLIEQKLAENEEIKKEISKNFRCASMR